MKGEPRAKRESPGVFLRGQTWWISYCGPRKDGSWGEIRESSKSPDRRKAENLRKRKLIEVANHRAGIRKFQGPAQERLTVGNLLDGLLRDYTARKMADQPTLSHLSHLRDFFGGRRASGVTRGDVDQFIAFRRTDKAADATIDRETALLKRAYNLAELAYAPKIPKLLKAHANARQGFLDRDGFEAILEQIPDADFRDYLEWFAWTGMRPGETASLGWASFDLQTWTLRLRAADAKIGEGRVIPIVGPLRPIIERRIAARRLDCLLIFHHSQGRPFAAKGGGLPNRCYVMWHKAAKEAGFLGLIPYDLRRTAARNLRAAGVAERVIMEITGHKTRAMFDRYGIVDDRDLKNAFESQERYINTLPRDRKVLAFSGAVSDKDRTK